VANKQKETSFFKTRVFNSVNAEEHADVLDTELRKEVNSEQKERGDKIREDHDLENANRLKRRIKESINKNNKIKKIEEHRKSGLSGQDMQDLKKISKAGVMKENNKNVKHEGSKNFFENIQKDQFDKIEKREREKSKEKEKEKDKNKNRLRKWENNSERIRKSYSEK